MGVKNSWEKARTANIVFGIFYIFQIILKSRVVSLILIPYQSWEEYLSGKGLISAIASILRVIFTSYLFWTILNDKTLVANTSSKIRAFFCLILVFQILSIISSFFERIFYNFPDISYKTEYFLSYTIPSIISLAEQIFFLVIWKTVNKVFLEPPLNKVNALQGSAIWIILGYIAAIAEASSYIFFWLSIITDLEFYILFIVCRYLIYVYPIILLIGYLRLGSKMKYIQFQETENEKKITINIPIVSSVISNEVKRCPDCGTNPSEGEEFCFKCGKRIERT